jgi:hypothetical protein
MSASITKAQLEAMDPLARQVFENEMRRRAEIWLGKPRRQPALKTHCHRGHELKGKNLRVYRYERETIRLCVRCVELRREIAKVKQSRAEREALTLLRKYNIRDRALLASARGTPKTHYPAA